MYTTVISAVTQLQDLGALDAKESLTPLGLALANLPVHPRIGKMYALTRNNRVAH